MSGQPGLAGVVPFRFACHRCGHCCTGGEGHVWVEEDEVAGLAASLGVEPDAFTARFLRTLPDPTSGALRMSLVEREGRCALLADGNHCTVYDARPRHCASFPFWEGVLSDPAAFERARAVCPGIAVEVEQERREAAFAELAELYEELEGELAAIDPRCELSGLCCRFEEAGHELYATALEADYALHHAPDPPAPEGAGRCPYHRDGRCTNRAGRALGCRSYFCDERHGEALEALHGRYLARVRAIEREHDYPAAYGRFPALLEARGKNGAAVTSEGP